MKNCLIVLFFLPIILFAREPWQDLFPETSEVFSAKFDYDVLDIETDAEGNLYVLSNGNRRFFVDVFSIEGLKIRSFGDSLKLTAEYTNPLCLRISERGEIVIVRGWDRLLETPVNWVFDSTGKDILEETHLLKYAEWLSVSPKGTHYTLQGYIRQDSYIPFIYNRNFEQIELEYPIENAVFDIYRGDEVFIATEIRENSRYLAIRKLDSHEILMERRLTEAENPIIMQEGKFALIDDALFVLTRVCRSPGLFCYSLDGALLWSDEADQDIKVMKPTLSREHIVTHGAICSKILGLSEEPILDFCDDFMTYDNRLFMSLDTEPTVWPDIEMLAVSFTLHLPEFELHSILLPYSNRNMLAPVQFEGKMGGFRFENEDYIVFAKEKSVTIYKIID